MKWVALIVILLVVVLIFGMVRRLQSAAAREHTQKGKVDVTERPVPSLGARTAAAEESVDEVPVTPVSERPPAVAADELPDPSTEDGWWQDGKD
ncbi:MAG TPA: hypothetical protein VF635_17440, partial [Propionibacteriaceae bacterium]